MPASHEEMTIDDAINAANVVSDCLAADAEHDVRVLAAAAKRLVRHVREQADELERERARARRSGPGRPDARLVNGHQLEERADGGGRRDFLDGRPVHAGETLYLLTSLGWYPVRCESTMPRKTSVLYLGLPGVREDVVMAVPREARFAWPEELHGYDPIFDVTRSPADPPVL